MSKFKVGDRVSVYGFDNFGVMNVGGYYTVAGYDSGDLIIESWDGTTALVHENQCRRLVKKERRRIWLTPSHFEKALSTHAYQQEAVVWGIRPSLQDAVEFVEVRNKKKASK